MHTTHDNLIDPAKRDITTVWTTGLRVNEGTYDAGTVRVALTTSHNKSRKRLESRINREVLTDSGFITRSIRMFEPSADAGITLATESVARFNANKARTLHESVLDNLDTLLEREDRQPEIAAILLSLLDSARDAEAAA